MDRRLGQIVMLMEMQVGASQTRLRQIRSRERQLIELLHDLDTRLIHAHEDAENKSIADFRNEVQLRRWIDQRRSSINIELAQVRVHIAMAQADLAKHFARQQAAGRLADHEQKTTRQKATRKSYETP